MSDTPEAKASCKRCDKLTLTEGNARFCNWLLAEIPRNLPNDPGCEGYHEKGLRTSKAEVGPSHAATSLKGDDKPVTKPSKTACPKTPDKSLIQTALKLKGFKGSVVMEKVCCGKRGCHCLSGMKHGPYPYLHYFSQGKVRRKYLPKAMAELLRFSKTGLEERLEEVLGQGTPSESRPSGKSGGIF